MANTSIGTAWIQIKPTTTGLRSAVEKELNVKTGDAGTKAGESWGGSLVGSLKRVIAGAAIGKFIKDALGVSADFDASVSQIAATLGFSMNELNDSSSEAAQTMERLSDFAKEMGANTVFSANESAQALNYMALAGYDAETSIAMLPTVLNLAAAGNLDLARASDMVTDAQTALDLTLDQTTALVDQMARTASRSNTSVSQLGEAILTVGGTAQYMAGGTEELNSVLGVLADNGIKGAEAGTHLRNILLRLSSPTEDATKLLKKLGVQVFDTEGRMRSFSEIFPELNEAVSSLSDQQKLDIFSTLFNTRDIASANALLTTSVERWQQLGAEILNSQGAAEEMAAVQLDNLAGDVTLLKSAFEGFQIFIGEQLEPLLRPMVQTITELFSALSSGSLQIDQSVFDGVANFLATLVEMISQAVPALLEALPSIIEGIVLALTNPDFLSRIFLAGFTLLSQIALALPDVIVSLIEMLPTLIENLVNFLLNPENSEKIMAATVSLFMAIVTAVPKILVALINAFGALFQMLWDKLEATFGEFVGGFGEFLGGIIKGALNGVLTFIENFINTPIRAINSFIGLINKTFGAIGVNIGLIGEISLPRLAKGGIVAGIGTDTSDSNLYALSKGEYVIKAASARQIGYDNLDRMNRTGEASGKAEVVNNITINGYDRDPNELATIISRKIALRTQGVF